MATGMYMDTRLQQQFWGYGGYSQRDIYSQRDLYEPPPPIPNPSPPIGRLARPPLLVIPPIVPAPLTPTPVALMREIERYNRKKNVERAEKLAADRPAGPPVRPRRRRVWDDMFFDLPPTPPPRRASAPAAPVTHVTPSEPLQVVTASTAPAPSTANTATNTAPVPVVRAAPLKPLKELNGTLPPPLPLTLSTSNVASSTLVPLDGKAARTHKLLPVSANQPSFRTWLGNEENATTAIAVRPRDVCCEPASQVPSAELRIDISSLGGAAAAGAAAAATGLFCADVGSASAHTSLQVGSVAIAIA